MSAGAENVYTCERCKAMLVTIDRVDGVTPAFMSCGYMNPNGCGGLMHSAWYPKGPRPSRIPAPTHEWYRPEGEELAAIQRDRTHVGKATAGHVRQGGLLIRPIAAAGAVE